MLTPLQTSFGLKSTRGQRTHSIYLRARNSVSDLQMSSNWIVPVDVCLIINVQSILRTEIEAARCICEHCSCLSLASWRLLAHRWVRLSPAFHILKWANVSIAFTEVFTYAAKVVDIIFPSAHTPLYTVCIVICPVFTVISIYFKLICSLLHSGCRMELWFQNTSKRVVLLQKKPLIFWGGALCNGLRLSRFIDTRE